MMSWYIRPRQDMSLSTFSKGLYALYDHDIPVCVDLLVNQATGKTGIRVAVGHIPHEDAVKAAEIMAEATGFNQDAFRIMAGVSE